jgi:hypothetical protein
VWGPGTEFLYLFPDSWLYRQYSPPFRLAALAPSSIFITISARCARPIVNVHYRFGSLRWSVVNIHHRFGSLRSARR